LDITVPDLTKAVKFYFRSNGLVCDYGKPIQSEKGKETGNRADVHWTFLERIEEFGKSASLSTSDGIEILSYFPFQTELRETCV